MMNGLYKGMDDELKALAMAGDQVDHFATLSMLLQTERLVGAGAGIIDPAEAAALGPEEPSTPRSTTSSIRAASAASASSSSGVGGPLPGLAALFTSMQMHLHLLFNSFVDEQVKWIDEQRCAVKQAGVLPPLAKFPAFVERMEGVVRSVRVAGAARSTVVDSAYHKLAQALFRWLEAQARADDKYTHVALMENYQYFWLAFTHRSPAVAALASHTQQAQELFLTHLEAYVKWTLVYEDVLPEAFRFWDALEEALKGVAAEDVQFSVGLRKTDLRELGKGCLAPKAVAKALNNAAKRVAKHLPRNEGLARQVWMAVEAHVRGRFKRFQQLVAQCYQSEKLPLQWAELQQILQQIAHDAHFDAQSNVSDH